MGANSRCFFGIHQYEVHKEIPIKNKMDDEIGLIIISKCKNCGKIISKCIDYKPWN